jgi:hypothetical protein
LLGRRIVISPRIWTLEEANALVPQLSLLIGQQLARANELEERFARLKEARAGATFAVKALERELEERVRAYEAAWREVEELGVVVKDPRVGLCDFYGRVDDRLVWLCWRYGEEAVEHYHALDAGFAGRKPLTLTTRRRELN